MIGCKMCEEEKQLIIFQDRFSSLLEENIEAIKDERKLRGLISDYFPKEKWLNQFTDFIVQRWNCRRNRKM